MAYGDGKELDRFEMAMEAADIAWWWMDLPAGVVFFSPNKAKMIDRDPSDFVHYTNFTELVHPDDYEQMMQDMRDHLEGRKDIYETTYRIMGSDGKYRRFYDRGKIVGRKDGTMSLAGIVLNITNLERLKEIVSADA